MTHAGDLITIGATARFEQIVKGSRFFGLAARCVDDDAARAVIAAERAAHPDANHVCFAYRVAPLLRFSDDGEPGGTAGRPMAEVLTRRDLDRVVGVVVRRFGGVKLGTGGLVRAYAGTLSRTLDAAGVAVLPARVRVEVEAPFAHSDALFRLLDDRPDLERGEVAYRAAGVAVPLQMPAREVEAFERDLREVTRGAATVSPATELPPLDGA